MQFGRGNRMDRGDRGPPRRGGMGGGFPQKSVPVKEGQEYDVTIEGIGEKGDGIAKIEGFVIVIPGTQKGQKVRVKVNAVRGKVSFAEVVKTLGESDDAEESSSEDSESSSDSESSEDSEESEDDDELSDDEEVPEEDAEEEKA
jgi:predicted RNA-binding protein with TRAM domain